MTLDQITKDALREFDKRFTILTGTKKIRRVGLWLQPDSEFPTAYPADNVKEFLSHHLSQAYQAGVEEGRREDEPIRQAWLNMGSHPDYHRDAQEKLKKSWPTLYYAIQQLLSIPNPI